jgi:uncharacterized membrane protein YhaH (DUF805 family)
MEWMFLPLQRYADFSGRSRRKEFWLFSLGSMLAYIVFGAVFIASAVTDAGEFSVSTGITGAVFLAMALALVVPSLAVQVRRFHDQGKSGWLVLLNCIPYIGCWIVLVMMCLDGTPAGNAYGPDPKLGDRSPLYYVRWSAGG